MTHQTDAESPQPVAEAESLVGVAMHDLFACLLDRKMDVERGLLENDDRSKWLERPDRGGWWLWLEAGNCARTELILVDADGTHVADDDDWEQAIGRPPSDARGESENYWDGTEITQSMMPGLWLYQENDQREGRADNATPNTIESHE